MVRDLLLRLEEVLPESALSIGPLGIAWWQWAALLAVIVLGWGGGALASRVTRALLAPLAARTRTHWDGPFVERLHGPITLAWTLLFVWVGVGEIGLADAPAALTHRLLRGTLFLGFFWALLRAVDFGGQILEESAWARERPASRAILPLGLRVVKVAVAAIAVVALLSEAGYPVASLVAGLGIGGIALALAAQKTVENLFGAFSIGADQPFRQGDFVRIEDFVGTVESIGLRSTRIRTLDRTLITVPNGKLADTRVESFSARDRIRLACTIGLVYDTSASQMREVLASLEQALREHPKIWPEAVIVRFAAFAESSLNIEIMAWFTTSDWNEFQLIRQELFLQFMERVERAGTSFAFPTQTVHVVGPAAA